MGKTDRSPRMGNRVERDPGVSRKILTEITKWLRIPKISAKSTAVAVSAITVCIAVVVVSVIGGKNTPVEAADVYIGQENAFEEICGGVGRYSEVTEDNVVSETESVADAGAAISDNSDSDAEEANSSKAENSKRYTVTFAFHSRDSISCSLASEATVGEIAEKLGITFTESDVLNIPADTVISENTIVTTDKVTYIKDTVRTSIPYTTKYVDDASMYSGESVVSQYGKNGETVTEYEVKYVNGEEVSRTEINSYVAKYAVEQIIKRGTKVYTPPVSSVTQYGTASGGTFVGGDGKTYRYSTYIDVQATVYYTGGTCANGMPANESVIAVDPSVIPLGTQVYITGDYADIGVRTAADTGASIKGNIIDICVDPSNPLAGGFGFRSMRVYILE